ncbi:uncharacterized protein LOC113296512 [Papaver somniferum]|uniref:uncharacterized protein LOC113296512 n=1 Tax=Papaver somniferum TaxID=3469 RepID=UPI000E704A5F|nr:uncharacterized protein LOC113296512 [Papaver somniferum]
MNPEQAEALTAFEAVRWDKEKGFMNLHLEGDIQRVVNAINGRRRAIKWTNANIIQDIIYLLNNFNIWNCIFVHREGNNVADTIAKDALSFQDKQEWQQIIPSWLAEALASDETLLYDSI